MSRIIKSSVVVDRRPPDRMATGELDLTSLPVLKPQYLAMDGLPKRPRAPTREGLQNELLLLQADVVEAKDELRDLKNQVKELEEAKRLLEEERRAREESTPEEVEDPDGSIARARIVEQAHKDVEKLLEQAAHEADVLRQQAQDTGHQKGYELGRKIALEEFQEVNGPKAEQLEALIQRLTAYERERLSRDEPELIRLCTAIAEKIVGRELKTDPTVIQSMLWETMDRNRREESIKIVLSPDMLPLEMKASEDVCEILRTMGANVTVQMDKEAEPGTCVVETPVGLTDLSPGVQIANLEDALLHVE